MKRKSKLVSKFDVLSAVSSFPTIYKAPLYCLIGRARFNKKEEFVWLGALDSLWSLLPSFCNYSLDTAQCSKDLEEALSSALREEPDVRGIICSSLQIVIRQIKSILEAKDSVTERSISELRAISHYNSQVAADNLSVLRPSSHTLLSVLAEVFSKSSKDTSGSLQKISCFSGELYFFTQRP